MTATIHDFRCAFAAAVVLGSLLSSVADASSILELIGGDPNVFYDPSGGALVPAVHVSTALLAAQEGTLPSPGATLPAHSTIGVVPPGPTGVSTASFFDVFYDGPANDFPADSFFDVFLDFTQADPPGSNLRARGTVRVIHSAASSIAVGLSTQFAGGPELLFSLEGHINPAQPGLSFSELQVVQGTSPDPFATSFFDIFTELRFDGPGTINPNLPLFEITLTSVPEPSTWVLATAGLGALALAAYKRRWAT